MNSEQWLLIKTVFNNAILLPREEQVPYVDTELKHHPKAKQQVCAMLAQEDGQSSESEFAPSLSKIVSGKVESLLNEPDIFNPGDVIDNFKILSLIGEGGMGSVFLAQRMDEDFEQFVAIKVIHKQQVGDSSIQRFRRERKILALLNHRNIAGFIGGGTLSSGLPYIILEYVKGVSIIEYCQQHQLGTEPRLRLFKQVLSAISYAHQHLVIHRDIKPSNVLVTEQGDVKLLDFGIAKLIQVEGELADNDLTREQTRVLTPGNASPEQVVGEGITTRSDIYGLGTLLIHMLTEQPIFATQGATSRQIETQILEDTPIKPSKKCLQSETPEVRARASILRGDLDTIMLTAVQKDPQRRYATVEQFSEDISRFQDCYPISAKPDSVVYSSLKFVKRNTFVSAIAVCFVCFLVLFSSIVFFQAKQIQLERDIALDEASVSKQTTEFMAEIFLAADPNNHAGKKVTVEELLASAVSELDSFNSRPSIKAKLLYTLGNVYRNLTNFEQSKTLINEADQLLPKYPDITHSNHLVDRLEVDLSLMNLALAASDYNYAQQKGNELLRILEGPQAALLNQQQQVYFGHYVNHSMGNALSYDGKDEISVKHFKQALDLGASIEGKSIGVVALNNGYGHALRRIGQFEQAATVLNQAVELGSKNGISLDLAHALNQLASTYLSLNKVDEALEVAQKGLVMRQEIIQRPHPEIIASMGMVARCLTRLNRIAEAIEIRREMLLLVEQVVGRQHIFYAAVTQSLGALELEMQQLTQAEAYFTTSLDTHQALFPNGHYNTSRPLVGLGRIALARYESETAHAYFEQAWVIIERHLQRDHHLKAQTAAYYSVALKQLGQTSKASEFRQLALTIQTNLFGLDSEQYLDTLAVFDEAQDD